MAQSSPTGGIRCEVCHVRMEVCNTVNPCRGRVIRYRQCPKCGMRTKTIEVAEKMRQKPENT